MSTNKKAELRFNSELNSAPCTARHGRHQQRSHITEIRSRSGDRLQGGVLWQSTSIVHFLRLSRRGGYCFFCFKPNCIHVKFYVDTKTCRIPTPALLAVVEGRLSGDAGGSYILIRPSHGPAIGERALAGDSWLLNPSRNWARVISISSSAPDTGQLDSAAAAAARFWNTLHYELWIFFSLLRWKGKSEEEGLFTNQLFWNEKWIILTDLNWLKYYLLGPRWQRGWRARAAGAETDKYNKINIIIWTGRKQGNETIGCIVQCTTLIWNWE